MSEQTIRTVLSEAKQGFALVTLECRCYEPKKKDFEATRTAAETHGVDIDDLTVTKDTVIDPKIKRIKTLLNRARNYHYAATRPWAGRKVGIVRGQDLLDYAQKMNAYIKDFNEAVETAAKAWGTTVAEQAERLNGLFRIEDYPTAEQFRAKYALKYYINQLPDKEDWLLDVPEDAITELAGSFEDQMSSRMGDLQQAVLQETKKVLENVIEILSKGNPQSIRNALVSNVRKSMEWVRDLNLDNNDDMIAIVNTIEQYIVDVGADELRENQSKRLSAAKAAYASVRQIEFI